MALNAAGGFNVCSRDRRMMEMTVEPTEKVLGVVTSDNGNTNVVIGISETVWQDIRDGGAGFLTFDVPGSRIRLTVFGAATGEDVLTCLGFTMRQGNSSLIGETGVLPQSELILARTPAAELEAKGARDIYSSSKDDGIRAPAEDYNSAQLDLEEPATQYSFRLH